MIFRDVKRSFKDYLIYIITLIISITLFYAFLSISSENYKPDISPEYNINLLSDGMKMAICLITCLVVFLIKYVNNYMLLRKKKKIAIEIILGMERDTIAKLFLGETFVLGVIALAFGVFSGNLLSQFVSAMLLKTYGSEFKIEWEIYPDIAFLTIVFFLLCFIIIGFSNYLTISKMKIIELVNSEKMNEDISQNDRGLSMLTVIYMIIMLYATSVGISNYNLYYSNGFPLVVRSMFWSIILFPFLNILVMLIKLIVLRKGNFPKLRDVLMILQIPTIISFASVFIVYSRFYIAFGDRMTYILFLISCSSYFIFLLFHFIASAISNIRIKNKAITYRGENLFLFGQIITKLPTFTKTMSLICITIILSITIFISVPILEGWMFGFLEIRSLYDVQVFSQYNRTRNIDEVNSLDYTAIEDYMNRNHIDRSWECLVELYLTKSEEFTDRKVDDFPILAMSLSDYNAMRVENHLNPIYLENDEFVTQWHTIASDSEINKFISEHGLLETDRGVLKLSGLKAINENIGENLFNNYTNVVYVLPDEIAMELFPVSLNYYINTKNSIPYRTAEALDQYFDEQFPDQEEGVRYSIRIRTLQRNGTYKDSFILKASMIYLSVVLMIICFTILALQQLHDASNFKYRFNVLHKIGVDQKQINRLIFRQLGFNFGLPTVIAAILSGIYGFFLIKLLDAQISAYMISDDIMKQILFVVLLILSLILVYFALTWYLFRRSVRC